MATKVIIMQPAAFAVLNTATRSLTGKRFGDYMDAVRSVLCAKGRRMVVGLDATGAAFELDESVACGTRLGAPLPGLALAAARPTLSIVR